MKTLLVLLGGIALVAGYGVNWGNKVYRDGIAYKDIMFNYLGNEHDSFDTGLKYDKDIILDKTIGNAYTKTGYTGFGRDLKYTIMNDKDIFTKQKFTLDIFRNVYTTLALEDIHDVHFVEGENFYTKYDYVIPFFKLYKSEQLLTRGRVFTISDRIHRHQALLLFNLFYYSKDFEVFQRNVLWARYYINEDMFVYVLTAAIFHRPDMIGVKLPSIYEIIPQKFHTGFTLNQALTERLANLHDNVVIVKNKYTSDIVTMNDEAKLAYFTEDISWNQFHYYLHVAYPFWLGGEDFGLFKHMRGERYLYLMQQLLARYYMERLSHGLGKIDELSFDVPVTTGYNSFLRHYNGLGYSVRKNYYDIYTTGDYYLIDRIQDFERRIRDAIDKGYVISKDGGKIDLNKFEGIDILGNLIQSSEDSVNNRFYGGMVRMMRALFGGGYEKNVDYKNVLPSVMEYYETAFRDPVTYQLYKRILKLVFQFKNILQPYTTEDLLLKGVHVRDIHVSKLVTFFDYFDVDVTNIVNTDLQTHAKDIDFNEEKVVYVRHTRLNHKPFTVNIDIDSEVAQKVVVRLFLGPKFDEFGKLITLSNNRENFMQFDKFIYDLPAGHVTIKRDSRASIYNVGDRTTYLDLYKKILLTKDLNTLLELNIVENHCGFPNRLLLPRGWVSGMPMQFFAIITRPVNVGKGDSFITKCGRESDAFHVDNYNLGFPFDRRIYEGDFYTPNMFFKDVFIFHEGLDVNVGYKDYLGTKGYTHNFRDVIYGKF